MNRNSIDLIVFLSLVLLTIAISFFWVSRTTIEIQLHDTYLVLDKLTLTVLMLGPLTVLAFFPIAAMRNFKSIGTNIALIFGLVLVAVVCYSVAELQSSYINQLDESGLRENKPSGSLKQSMNVARGILAVIGLAALVLIYRTVKIWKATYSRPSL